MTEGIDPMDMLNKYADSQEEDTCHSKPLGEQMFGCFFDLLVKLVFAPSACGEVVVSAGSQELFINTCFTPSEVYISIGETEGKPGCGPISDSFDIQHVSKGFLLKSKTNSPRRKIKWKAIG